MVVQILMHGIMMILLHSINHPGGKDGVYGDRQGTVGDSEARASLLAARDYRRRGQLALEHERHDIAT
jgi:hypothetical protein